MKKNNLFMYLIILLIGIFAFNISPKAEDYEAVAKIGDTEYTSFADAIKAVQNDETIELLANCDSNLTSAWAINKNVTIKGDFTVTFDDYSFGITGNNTLTLDGSHIVINNAAHTAYSDNPANAAIMLDKGGSLTLDNGATLIIDAPKGDGIATWDTTKDMRETINIFNGSVLEVKNATNGGGIEDYNNATGVTVYVNIDNGSYVYFHNNYSGFIATLNVTVTNSRVDVVDNNGSGSNGSNYYITNSKVKFSNNGGHGLSSSTLVIDNSRIEAKSNGGNGIHVNGLLDVKNKSNIIIENNECAISSKWTFPGALLLTSNNKHNIDSTSTVTITKNYGSGISLVNGSLNIADGSQVTITENTAYKLELGGGIYIASGKEATLSKNIVLYNNHAVTAGDDIYSLGTITFSSVKDDWYLNKGVSFDFTAKYNNSKYSYSHEECEHKINGWYDDSEDNRWEAHGLTEEEDHIVLVNANTYTEKLAVKAAHDKMKGTVVVKYVDTLGNELAKEEAYKDVLGKEYKTQSKDIEDYKLVRVEGNEIGIYTEDTIYVTYVYDLYVGNVIVKYVDTLGNELADEVEYSGIVGKYYETTVLDIKEYTLISVEGEEKGVYIDGTIYVTYYYDKNTGTGDIEPPKTGVTVNVITSLNPIEIILYKKEEDYE